MEKLQKLVTKTTLKSIKSGPWATKEMVKLKIGARKLEIGTLKLEIGIWKLEIGA